MINFQNILNKLHFIKLQTDHIPFPEVFEIELTNTCNLRCRMCHMSLIEQDTPINIDVSLINKLNTVKGKWVCIGSNFEPLMNRNFIDIVKTLSDMDCKIDLTTNGTLLTQEITDQLVGCNIQNITISFDGIKKETYEKVRRKSKYETTIEHILYFREAMKHKETYFAINYVMLQSNIDELMEAIDFWESKDFHQLRFIFMVIRAIDKGLLLDSLYPVKEYAFTKLDGAAKHVIDNNLKITLSSPYFYWSKIKDIYPNNVTGNIVKSENPNARDHFNARHYYQKGKYHGMRVDCRAPFTFARVLSNGDVQLCYQYVIGNLNKHCFDKIWNGEEALRIRQMILTDKKICNRCDYYRFCLNSNKIDINDRDNYFSQDLIKESELLSFDT